MLPTIHGEFRMGTDPELRFTPSGVAVASFRAVASSRKEEPKGSGNWVDDKSAWVKVTAFQQLAENIAESLLKGMLVVIDGRLEIEEWEDRDGAKRQTPNILVNTIGPALKYATAKVSKVESQGAQQQSSSRQQTSRDDDPWAAPPAQNDEPPF